MADSKAMITIIVMTETSTETYEDEIQVEADATDKEINGAASDAFFNRCNYGWRRKDETGG